MAVVWALFDFNFLQNAMGDMGYVLLPFMLLHLMPVWIYLAGAVFSLKKYRNTYYIITDHRVYVSGGIFTINLETKTFAELSHINLHRGIFDQFFNVGDVQLTTNQFTNKGTPAVIALNSI